MNRAIDIPVVISTTVSLIFACLTLSAWSDALLSTNIETTNMAYSAMYVLGLTTSWFAALGLIFYFRR